jgi:hypothetical protein
LCIIIIIIIIIITIIIVVIILLATHDALRFVAFYSYAQSEGGGLLLVGCSGLPASVSTEQTVSRHSTISAGNSSITAQTSSS